MYYIHMYTPTSMHVVYRARQEATATFQLAKMAMRICAVLSVQAGPGLAELTDCRIYVYIYTYMHICIYTCMHVNV